jgi:hypothetical protein
MEIMPASHQIRKKADLLRLTTMKTLSIIPNILLCLSAVYMAINFDHTQASDLYEQKYLSGMVNENSYIEETIVDFDNLNTKAPAKYLNKRLKAGKTYVLEAKADYRIADLDMEVRNSKGVILAQDDSSDQDASIIFSPRYSGIYKIRFSVYEFKQGSSNGYYNCLMTH